jgi:hypothetical protein
MLAPSVEPSAIGSISPSPSTQPLFGLFFFPHNAIGCRNQGGASARMPAWYVKDTTFSNVSVTVRRWAVLNLSTSRTNPGHAEFPRNF